MSDTALHLFSIFIGPVRSKMTAVGCILYAMQPSSGAGYSQSCDRGRRFISLVKTVVMGMSWIAADRLMVAQASQLA